MSDNNGICKRTVRTIEHNSVKVLVPIGTGRIPDFPDLGWAAGIIDGEGCITIGKSREKHRRTRNPYYALHLIVAANGVTGSMMTKRFQELFGEYRIEEPPTHETYKRRFRWYCHGWKAIFVLARLYPFLISKKKEADIAFAFQQLKGTRGKKTMPEVLEKMEICWQTLKDLHHVI